MAKKKSGRFVVVYEQSLFTAMPCQIVQDRQTNVQYLVMTSGGSVTPLLDGEGRPLLGPPIKEDGD